MPDCDELVVTIFNPAGNQSFKATVVYGAQTQTPDVPGGQKATVKFTGVGREGHGHDQREVDRRVLASSRATATRRPPRLRRRRRSPTPARTSAASSASAVGCSRPGRCSSACSSSCAAAGPSTADPTDARSAPGRIGPGRSCPAGQSSGPSRLGRRDAGDQGDQRGVVEQIGRAHGDAVAHVVEPGADVGPPARRPARPRRCRYAASCTAAAVGVGPGRTLAGLPVDDVVVVGLAGARRPRPSGRGRPRRPPPSRREPRPGAASGRPTRWPGTPSAGPPAPRRARPRRRPSPGRSSRSSSARAAEAPLQPQVERRAPAGVDVGRLRQRPAQPAGQPLRVALQRDQLRHRQVGRAGPRRWSRRPADASRSASSRSASTAHCCARAATSVGRSSAAVAGRAGPPPGPSRRPRPRAARARPERVDRPLRRHLLGQRRVGLAVDERRRPADAPRRPRRRTRRRSRCRKTDGSRGSGQPVAPPEARAQQQVARPGHRDVGQPALLPLLVRLPGLVERLHRVADAAGVARRLQRAAAAARRRRRAAGTAAHPCP